MAKAESLLRHANYLGIRGSEFAVALTNEEAFEMLDYLLDGNSGLQDETLLRADARIAKRKKDPWIVLQHFQILGLDVVRLDQLH